MSKKILVTGSNGLLGQKLITLISKEKEFELIATSKGENRVADLFPEMNYYSLDICNRNQVLDLIEKINPEFIINTAAMTNVDQCEDERELCWDLNVNAVKYLVEASEKNNCFLVHLSTDFIFDGENGPYDESAEPNPLSYYGESKLEAEKIILASSIRYAIARTVLVYGIVHNMSRSNIILWVKKSLEEGQKIKVVNDQFRTPTLAEDLAMGCYLICKKEATGIFNISGYELLTPYEMAMATASFFKLDKELIQEVDSSVFTQRAQRPPRTGFILDKAKKQLAFKPLSFSEGIEVLSRQINNG